MSVIKILIGYHKPAPLFKSEILMPIHGGRDCCLTEESKDGKLDQLDYKWLINNCIGDNTGDNVSIRNRMYNEMSCIYWAWKNYDKIGNPDYIGFMQYGKHLILNEYMEIPRKQYITNSEVYCYELSNYQNNNNLSYENVKKAINGFDVICTKKLDVSFCYNKKIGSCKDSINILTEGKGGIVFDYMCQYIKDNFYNMKKYVEDIENDYIYYPFNTFIMKKNVFFSYCNFIFNVLDAIIKKFDFADMNAVQKRTPAFLSELITSIFLSSIENNKNIKTCPLAVIVNENNMLTKDDFVVIMNYQKYKFSYYWYKFYKIMFGKIRKRYKEKYKLAKATLKQVEIFLNNNK